ncbi:2-amino-4-hydroxy-6-hydroxymethyldihydropteridine diphosphokinase [Parasulfuritortus cantonensis]|uniref:2-amino-4-hydroxy-6-hydroxymethyldihydropteridine pyrophosphokinase n=1 Tax=Parasulfuritortus cantonensis TaxID=2528202 RepID=A0A4R1B6K1_9PROT|nr:2-amino-4-hydroxy-6-hydroxymethyldihydropteridine diphosphokinase [Parasulfuritortus cantonensis]TCJ11908.1 2-amino-4-hydroxy-6-hydroxymethyldihydropteridine diphosphokinase [Parasulfuritortus cantonensis]
MSRAYIALGGNLDGPARRIERALADLGCLPHCRLLSYSALYRTAPVGYADQPDFVNAVAVLETALLPERLMAELLALEARHGRVRTRRDGPRTLDLDLLLYETHRQCSAALTLPHPRMHLRAFVLVPLLDVAPDCVIPGHGRADRLLARLPERAEVRRLGPAGVDAGYLMLCQLGRGMMVEPAARVANACA